ncbi:MAG TPA: flavin reductase family protein [Caulobacteraceae bacterium]|jgi:3-hydroxy-9,10-secoandrosta-1,3,5(10)-triene-9,17-dione monooxygenase reductase component|nr:flavin reductase family protein [Caulobacteraceae bacterium]
MASDLTAAPAGAPTAAEWRAAMGYFPTGVTVVTSWGGRAPLGSTINAFCSVSLDPPLLLICLDNANPLRGPVEACGVFGVNILPAEGGRELALHFARNPESDRFADLDWEACEGGAPQLKAAPIFVDCQVQAIHPAGDHVVVIGRGVRTHRAPHETPLLYHRGSFPDLRPAS